MNDHLQAAMTEATRLTRAGRLAKATAMIQRALGSAPSAPVVEEGAGLSSTTLSLPRLDSTFGVHSSPGVIAHPTSRELLPGILPGPGGMRPASAHTRGQFVKKVYTTAAGTRAYRLYIPSGYRGQAVPLVVMLHGCTQTPGDFAAGTRMNVLAEGETFLVAYPEQAPSANSSKCWNWFQQDD